MARFTLCFFLLAAALGHAVQPAGTVDKSIPASNTAVLAMPLTTTPSVVPESRNGIALATDDDGTCYKIRAYIFKRDDDHAPEFVRSTTCGPRQPRTKDAAWPKARLVPAD
ncbi:MAG: hypothetical protein WBM04_09935 [Candidatus Korobacteraceae bacterium]